MLTETQMHDALATADLDAAIALLQAPAQYRALFKDDQGGVRFIAHARQVADAADHGYVVDPAALLNAYAVLASGLDLDCSVHYLALAAQVMEGNGDADSAERLALTLHPHALMHGYFAAGGTLDLIDTRLDVSRDAIASASNGGVRLAYERGTMVCFPLRLSTADRDRLFRHGGFALLPSKHWHDHDALREVMQGSAYLEWLDARPLYLSQVLTCALEELASPPWVRALLAHGYPVSADADALGDDHDFN